MLPCIKAQDRVDVDASRRDAALAHLGVFPLLSQSEAAHIVTSRLETLLAGLADIRVDVNALTAPVRARVRGSGEVSGQDLERGVHAGVGNLDEPDESGAEHGVGRVDHLAPQGLDGAEGLLEVALEVIGHGDCLLGQAVEEEVVVVRHTGIVEDGGVMRFPRRLEDDVLDFLVVEVGF